MMARPAAWGEGVPSQGWVLSTSLAQALSYLPQGCGEVFGVGVCLVGYPPRSNNNPVHQVAPISTQGSL